jgi:hypothetical protein
MIGAYPELYCRDVIISSEKRYGFLTETTGTVHLELTIIPKDF